MPVIPRPITTYSYNQQKQNCKDLQCSLDNKPSAISKALMQAHIICPQSLVNPRRKNQDALQTQLFSQFIKLERGQQDFPAFVLHYDFYKSHHYFNNHYRFLTCEIFNFIQNLAYLYDFRWKGSISGDGAFLALSSSLDPNLDLNFQQALSQVCKFSHDLFNIFKHLNFNHLLLADKHLPQLLHWSADLMPKLKQIAQQNNGSFFHLRIGVAFGRVGLCNNLASLYPAQENIGNPMLAGARISSYSWGAYLEQSLALNKQFEATAIQPKQVFNLISIEQQLCLVKFDSVVEKKVSYPAYRIFHFRCQQAQQTSKTNSNINKTKIRALSQDINRRVTHITSWSEHNHFEGNYSTQPISPQVKQISLKNFIANLQTWRMQVKMLQAANQHPDSRSQRKQAMKQACHQFCCNVIDKLKQQNIRQGFLFISPYNLSMDGNGLTELSFNHLDPTAFNQVASIPKYFQPLPMVNYLKQIKTGLKRNAPELKLKLILSLRREQVEARYLTHADAKQTQRMLDELQAYQKEGLIAGVDICGLETELSTCQMKNFLSKLQQRHLLHSIHAGEVSLDSAYQGLDNMIEAVLTGVKRIGQGFAFFSLLLAQSKNHQLLTNHQSRQLLNKIAQTTTSQKRDQQLQAQLASQLRQFLVDKQVIIQVNLVSNLFTVLQQTISGTDLQSKSFLKKFRHHPLIQLLLKQGAHALDKLPRLILSADDYVATNYTLEQELETLIVILLEHDFSLEAIAKILEKFDPSDLHKDF